jgi:hypothetical protein
MKKPKVVVQTQLNLKSRKYMNDIERLEAQIKKLESNITYQEK